MEMSPENQDKHISRAFSRQQWGTWSRFQAEAREEATELSVMVTKIH